MHRLTAFLATAAIAFTLCAAPAIAGMSYFVVVGYAEPKVIAGPFDDLSGCMSAARGYNERNSSSDFHCVLRYVATSSYDAYPPPPSGYQAATPAPYYKSATKWVVQYTRADFTKRTVSGPFEDYGECLRVAMYYNAQNSDYRYSCGVHY